MAAFPNPAQDVVRIVGAPDAPLTLTITNGLGQELRRQERSRAQSEAIDLNGLPAGPLFLRVNDGVVTTTVRLLHVH